MDSHSGSVEERMASTHTQNPEADFSEKSASDWTHRIQRPCLCLPLTGSTSTHIAEAFLCGGAQFAYLPGRNAAQAIHRVAGHCHFVQQQCSYATPTVVDRHSQQPKRNPHFAGMQLSLDLSQCLRPAGLEALGQSIAICANTTGAQESDHVVAF